MPQELLRVICKSDALFGTLSVVSTILTFVQIFVSVKEDKKVRKIYILGIIIALVFGAAYLYSSGYTSVPDATGKYYEHACSILMSMDIIMFGGFACSSFN